MRRHGTTSAGFFRLLTFPLGLLAIIFSLLSTAAYSQAFSSGSTGADGAFNPSSNVKIPLPPNGTFNYTTVNIPSGVTVTYTRNAANTPVTILASGDVTISGTIDISGTGSNNGPSPFPTGGPGGFDGGWAGNLPIAQDGFAGLGPGGGKGAPSTGDCHVGAGGGFGTAGKVFGFGSCPGGPGGSVYGTPTLLPLIGGSGGGSVLSPLTVGGGGGGGAILIASSGTITLSGTIRAEGGNGGPDCGVGCPPGIAGGGSGGAIRLVASKITGAGFLSAIGGGPGGGVGRIRLEADVLTSATLTSKPTPTVGLPGALTTGAKLKIVSVGGVAAPATPQATYLAPPDLVLSPVVTNPVIVNLLASNVPVGTLIAVTVTPEGGAPTTVTSTALAGTLDNSTATATVTLPSGIISVISATATFATGP